MLTVSRAKKIADFLKAKEEISKEIPKIDYGNTFKCVFLDSKNDGKTTIFIEKKMIEETKKLFNSYFREVGTKLNLNLLRCRDFIETFALLHELGHYMTNEPTANGFAKDVASQYNAYRHRVFKDRQESFNFYRTIKIEELADNFAIDMLNKYGVKLLSISSGVAQSKIKKVIEGYNVDFINNKGNKINTKLYKYYDTAMNNCTNKIIQVNIDSNNKHYFSIDNDIYYREDCI